MMRTALLLAAWSAGSAFELALEHGHESVAYWLRWYMNGNNNKNDPQAAPAPGVRGSLFAYA